MKMQSAKAWAQVRLTSDLRAQLRQAIRMHPEVSKYVKSTSVISSLNKVGLLELAKRLGIDFQALQAAQSELKLSASAVALTPFHEDRPFVGVVEFEITMGFLGKSVARRARVSYEHQPEWAYFNPETGEEIKSATSGGSYGLEIESVAEGEIYYSGDEVAKYGRTVRKKSETAWEKCNDLTEIGIFTDEMWEALMDLVDQECRVKDQQRRKQAIAKLSMATVAADQ